MTKENIAGKNMQKHIRTIFFNVRDVARAVIYVFRVTDYNRPKRDRRLNKKFSQSSLSIRGRQHNPARFSRPKNFKGEKLICISCVTPAPLKKFISEDGAEETCHYCRNKAVAIEKKLLFDYILERVDENVATENDLSYFELGMIYECGADDISVDTIDIVLSEWLNLADEPYLCDLMAYVPSDYVKDDKGRDRHFFFDDGTLERNFYEEKWKKFIEDIRHSHRFFGPNARIFLDSLFSFLSSAEDKLKPECIRIISRGEELYRARTVQTYGDAKLIGDNPSSHFGPAPKDRASSQQMTPNGISALYCALDRGTCLSEIRSMTGDNVVSVGMTPITRLNLLDLTKLAQVKVPKLTSLNKGYLNSLHLQTFVTSLVQKMSKPKGRSDDLSYLSTQVVFEFLRLRFRSQVDGLVFPSVQTGEKGTNVVLFPEASVISQIIFTTPTEIEKAFGDKPDEPFEVGAKLACIHGSIRFHKIKAIETHAIEYHDSSDLFMSDENKRRLHIVK
ncbi:MAG: RES family NAD+ phosphorylase [Pseudomonadota bacterium]